ncbi:hypothetical protein N658DRAFT_509422 [Parathielavia hyrcaniae]|uniref:Uncharacterized protein n=1 Tax=Parathielavia hyrcaniae TaxID=113614 RepID=A0AAN6SZJ5_9PEZI|nr:hypothetical protein N658DRAFT_509422 [Parathielavia hyrcaniae]
MAPQLFYPLPSSPTNQVLDRFSLLPDSLAQDLEDPSTGLVPFWPLLTHLLLHVLPSSSPASPPPPPPPHADNDNDNHNHNDQPTTPTPTTTIPATLTWPAPTSLLDTISATLP